MIFAGGTVGGDCPESSRPTMTTVLPVADMEGLVGESPSYSF